MGFDRVAAAMVRAEMRPVDGGGSGEFLKHRKREEGVRN
jgi:hypothetical protein